MCTARRSRPRVSSLCPVPSHRRPGGAVRGARRARLDARAAPGRGLRDRTGQSSAGAGARGSHLQGLHAGPGAHSAVPVWRDRRRSLHPSREGACPRCLREALAARDGARALCSTTLQLQGCAAPALSRVRLQRRCSLEIATGSCWFPGRTRSGQVGPGRTGYHDSSNYNQNRSLRYCIA